MISLKRTIGVLSLMAHGALAQTKETQPAPNTAPQPVTGPAVPAIDPSSKGPSLPSGPKKPMNPQAPNASAPASSGPSNPSSAPLSVAPVAPQSQPNTTKKGGDSAPKSPPRKEPSVPAEEAKSGKIGLGYHPLLLPPKSELSCHWGYSCYFGLPAGFAIGSDLLGMSHAVGVQPTQSPGKWLLWDIKLGWELPFSNENFSQFIALGYKNLNHDDSEYRHITKEGFTLALGNVMDLGDKTAFGLWGEVWLAEPTSNMEPEIHCEGECKGKSGPAARKTFYRFYSYARNHPYIRFRTSLDQHLFGVNLPSLGFTAPIHFYLPITGVFDLVKHSQKDTADITETNFGAEMQLQLGYSTDTEEDGRRGFYVGYGALFLASIVKAKQKNLEGVPNGQEAIDIRPTKRSRITPLGSLGYVKEF